MHVPRPVLRTVVRRVVRPVLGTGLQPPVQRRTIDALTRAAVLPRGTRVEAGTLGGVGCERITTPASRPDRHLIYLHGGGYTVGSPTTHRAAVAHLAQAARVTAHLLDYRLAPEHPYPAAVDDALAAYRALLESGPGPDQVAVAGDSAGGGLSLALALRSRAEGVALPAAIGLISPWVDLRLTGLADRIDDPLLTRAWLTRNTWHYVGGDRTLIEHPEVSPLLADPADLAALPPLVVHGASDELFIDDIERFVDVAREAGAEVAYRRLDGHWHVTHLYAGMMREATEAVADLGTRLAAHLAP